MIIYGFFAITFTTKKPFPFLLWGNSACLKNVALYSYSDWKSFIKSIEL